MSIGDIGRCLLGAGVLLGALLWHFAGRHAGLWTLLVAGVFGGVLLIFQRHEDEKADERRRAQAARAAALDWLRRLAPPDLGLLVTGRLEDTGIIMHSCTIRGSHRPDEDVDVIVTGTRDGEQRLTFYFDRAPKVPMVVRRRAQALGVRVTCGEALLDWLRIGVRRPRPGGSRASPAGVSGDEAQSRGQRADGRPGRAYSVVRHRLFGAVRRALVAVPALPAKDDHI
jgi:hypothetical protein